MRRFINHVSLIAALTLLICSVAKSEEPRTINLGYFEGGTSSYSSLLRGEISRLLANRSGDSLNFRFVPFGFGSAEWKRDSSKTLAKELCAEKRIDLFITTGPWAVEDLLEAGCKKPIVALHRIDPKVEQLIDLVGRSNYENLTVHYRPDKFKNDFAKIIELTGFKKIGVLFFPSGDEADQLLDQITQAAAQLGAEIVSASAFNVHNTFAYFKAYQEIKKKSPQILYVGPLWGLDNIQSVEFWSMLARDRMPAFSWEGDIAVRRGALGTTAGLSFVAESYAATDKIMRIIHGARPSELNNIFPQEMQLFLNEATADSCQIEFPRFLLLDAEMIKAEQPADQELIDLDQALQRVLWSHPTQLAREDRLEAAAKRYRAVKAEYYPQLSARASAFHQDDNSVYNSHNWIDGDGYSASVALEQTIFSLESLRGMKAAKAQEELTRTELDRSAIELQQATTLAYLSYLQAYEESRIIAKDREHIRLYQEISRARALDYPEDSLDIAHWERQWHLTTGRAVQAEYNLKASRAVLTALMNLPENYPFLVDTISFGDEKMFGSLRLLYLVADTEKDQTTVRQMLITEALENDPNLATARAQIDLQRKLLDAKSASYYPTLKLRADYRLADSLADWSGTFEEEPNSWTVAGILELPLWLGGRRSAEKASLKADLSAMEYSADAVSLETMDRISDLLFDLFAKSERMPTAFRQRRAARELLDKSVAIYERGDLSATELADAHSGVADAELSMISTRYQFFADMAKLAGKLGWNYNEKSTFDKAFTAWLSELAAKMKQESGN